MTSIRKAITVLTILLATALAAQASLVYSVSNGSVNARATFTFGAGTLTILLQNLQSGIRSSGQVISGLQFNGLAGTTLAGAWGELTSYNGGSWSAPTPTTALAHWGITGNTDLWTLTGGKPNELIIGPNAGGNRGIGNFDPYVYESATFVLDNANFNAGSTITGGVSFQFGTGPDGTLTTQSGVFQPNGGIQPVPEPATVFAGALVLLPVVVRGARMLRKT